MLYDFLKKYAVRPLLKIFFRIDLQGIEHVPATGGAILASNHLSVSDSVFLPAVLERPVVFLAKDEYFNGKGLKGRFTAWFFRNINQLPMDRSGGAKSAQSLASANRALHEGQLLGIYPEGTRSPDGRLYRAKLGVAKLALETGVPVIPVAMLDTHKVQPIGRRIPRPGRIGIRIGAPLDFSELNGQAKDSQVLRQVTDEIREEIQKLSGQQYVDVYAPRKR